MKCDSKGSDEVTPGLATKLSQWVEGVQMSTCVVYTRKCQHTSFLLKVNRFLYLINWLNFAKKIRLHLLEEFVYVKASFLRRHAEVEWLPSLYCLKFKLTSLRKFLTVSLCLHLAMYFLWPIIQCAKNILHHSTQAFSSSPVLFQKAAPSLWWSSLGVVRDSLVWHLK